MAVSKTNLTDAAISEKNSLQEDDLFYFVRDPDGTPTDAKARERAINAHYVSQAAHGFSIGDVVRHDGTSFVAATADTASNARVLGIVDAVPNTDAFVFRAWGKITGLTSLSAGSVYYLQDAGGLGTSPGTIEVPLLLADSTTSGWLLPIAIGGGATTTMDDLGDADTTTQTPTSGDALTWDGSNWTPLKHNLAATAAPTASDDSTANYEVGSLWLDTTNDKAYVCLDATGAAAVWTEITAAASSLNDLSDVDTATQSPTTDDGLRYDGANWVPLVHNFDATAAPTASDDSGSNYEPGSLWVDVTNDKAYVCLDASAGAAIWTEITQAGSGSTTFVGLSDTPSGYTGDGGKHLAVNSAENAVEFVETDLQSFVVAASDETTALTTGTGKVTFRMPYAFTLTAVRASVTTAPAGSTITVDINESGTSILSTKLTIDAGEKTSTTAATAAVISDSALADDAEMTVDIDQVGSSTAGAGLKVTLIGRPT